MADKRQTKSRNKEGNSTSVSDLPLNRRAPPNGDTVLFPSNLVDDKPPTKETGAAYALSSAEVDGEAEAQPRFYEYAAKSSMVLTTDSRPRDTHEPETLWGRIDKKNFGDRAVQAKPPELEERLTKSRKKKEGDSASAAGGADGDVDLPRRRRSGAAREESVLSLADYVVYKPQTKETRAAYEAMLSIIQQQFGGQPMDVIGGAADEVLTILKNDMINKPDKKKEITTQMFEQFVSIHDASDPASAPSGDAVDTTMDDDIGVAVEFEKDDDEESDFDQVQDELGEDDINVGELNRPGGMEMGSELDEEDMQNSNEGLNVNVQDIDAYWLQRKITQAYAHIDPQQSQKLAEEILKIIAEGDDRDVENRLVMELDYEKFDLIKLVLRNRIKKVCGTGLARAEDQEERKKIEEEMMGNPSLAPILEQLHATRASAKERQKNLEKSIRDEAKRLLNNNSGAASGPRERRAVDRDMENGLLKGQRQLLDLDNLSFHQGGLLMANKKCELPDGSFRTPHKGYEELHVPVLKPRPYATNEKIVRISDIPAWAQPAFAGMQQLNRVQSKVYDTALFKPDNSLLCAPTGAGKTNVAVLTILHQIGLHMKDGEFDNTKYKIVYVAPMKALVAEVVGNLSARLQDFGLTVRELSGDQNLYGLPADIMETDKTLDERRADLVQDELGEDDINVGELNRPGGMEMGSELDEEDMQNSNEGLNVNVQDIDAYWLQRKITQAYAHIDPQQSQKLAEEILKIIAEGDDRDVQNRLVMELDYEKFDLIKLVLRNRFNIVWCTRLARAEDQEERKKIEEEMMGNPSLAPILEQLHATRASAKERQKNLEKIVRDEAKRLLNNDNASADGLREGWAVDRDMDNGLLKGQRQLLDLDNLSFHQGGLLMANKKCILLDAGPSAAPRKCWSILFLFLLLVLSFSTMGVAADSDGAWCDAHTLSVNLSMHCEVTQELQTRDCCDAIFATLGRNGCLCKVVQEPEFRTSGMAGGSIIVQMYYSCDGGPHVSVDAEEECDKVESSPPPPPLPPPPPSPAREDPRLPGHTLWIRAGWILGAFVVFTLVICGCWRLYMRIGNGWFGRGRGHRVGGQLPWWRAFCNSIKEAAQDMVNRIKQVLQERRYPSLPQRRQRLFTSFHEMMSREA